MPAYLIQGFFFQWRVGFGIGFDPKEGQIATVHQMLSQDIYAGAIWPDPASGDLIGAMTDRYGESELSDIKLTESEFVFKKKYLKRQYVIRYSFKKTGDTWVGEFNSGPTGGGMSRCVLTLVPEDFFDPNTAAMLLGKPEHLEAPDIMGGEGGVID